jgi:hypothetical protein
MPAIETGRSRYRTARIVPATYVPSTIYDLNGVGMMLSVRDWSSLGGS